MRIYLDNCCFNRPFDDQRQERVRDETEAKLAIQAQIRSGALELVWSYMLDFENDANPFEERRVTIAQWRKFAIADIVQTDELIANAAELARKGLRAKDALHVTCAIVGGCQVFLTTDDKILNRRSVIQDIMVLAPPAFIQEKSP